MPWSSRNSSVKSLSFYSQKQILVHFVKYNPLNKFQDWYNNWFYRWTNLPWINFFMDWFYLGSIFSWINLLADKFTPEQIYRRSIYPWTNLPWINLLLNQFSLWINFRGHIFCEQIFIGYYYICSVYSILPKWKIYIYPAIYWEQGK